MTLGGYRYLMAGGSGVPLVLTLVAPGYLMAGGQGINGRPA